MSDAQKWISRWGHELSPSPVRPGVWRRRQGGYLLRARALCPRTGKLKEVKRVVLDAKGPADAAAQLAALLAEIRHGRAAAPSRTRFHEYVALWVERHLASGDVRSPLGRQVLAHEARQVLRPCVQDLYVDAIRPADLLQWRREVGQLVEAGELGARTANRYLKLLIRVVRAAVSELELPRDPSAGLRLYDTSEVETYSRERPNRLTREDQGLFVWALRQVAPHLWLAVVLGFATGLRPSSLRPLRGQGPNSDVLWDEGILLIRRSYVTGRILNRTKQGRGLEVALPQELLELLRQHLAQRPPELASCELLFPRPGGELLGPNDFRHAFERARKLLGWQERWVTPRAMRRTFQDVTRLAAVRDLVTRSISGHSSPEMQQLYSTVELAEQREAITAALRPSLRVLQGGVQGPAAAGGAPGGADDGAPEGAPAPLQRVR